MIKLNKIVVFSLLVTLFPLRIQAEDSTNPLVSRGGVTLSNGEESVSIETSDLYNLRTALEDLETKYDQGIITALGSIGTNISTTNPTFEELINGIVHSQDISTSTIADNLSAGKEAWVNGEKIVGTGVDNDYFYDKGYAEGYAKVTNASISYTYHKHKDGSGNILTTFDTVYSNTSPGGCYRGNGHNHTSTCTSREESYTEKCGGSVSRGDGGLGDGGTRDVCNSCGKMWEAGTGPSSCYKTVTKKRTVWNCGYPTNIWVIGCGKTEQTIESATIVFN